MSMCNLKLMQFHFLSIKRSGEKSKNLNAPKDVLYFVNHFSCKYLIFVKN